MDSQVIVEKKGMLFIDIIAHINNGFDVTSMDRDFDPYTAFDMAISRLRSELVVIK